jgi:hypothetical protein
MLDAHVFFAEAPASALLRAANAFRPRSGRTRETAPAPRMASLIVSVRRAGLAGIRRHGSRGARWSRGRGLCPPSLADRFRQAVVVKARSVRNRRAGGTGARTAWDRACARAAPPVQDAHFHDLRAKALTDAKRQGKDAQALAGHADPKMIAHYTKAREIIEVEPVRLTR